MKEIFDSIRRNIHSSTDTVLCTIVRKSGSGPRDVGAQMLVGACGLLCGTIGGGAVELQAVQHAMECIKTHQSDVHDYFLYINQTEDIGMICGGNVSIHFQYISSQNDIWETLSKEILESIDSHIPGILLLSKDGKTPRFLKNTNYSEDDYYPVPLACGNRVILFGAGHVSLALAPVLHTIGFRVTVFDDRPDFANRERFPEAESILIGDYANIAATLNIQDDDYIVVLTSGHSHDYEVEKQILKKNVAYLGVIGSKKKTAAINEKLLADGFDPEVIASVHAPIGLPIGAVTPEEISISIAAEMILIQARHTNDSSHTPCPV